MIHPCILKDGSEMVLCAEHRSLAEIAVIRPAVTGAKWTCKICTMTRQLTQSQAKALVEIIPSDSDSKGTHVVTKVPTGVVYCDCLAWRFQKRPPAERTCKHIERSAFAKGMGRR